MSFHTDVGYFDDGRKGEVTPNGKNITQNEIFVVIFFLFYARHIHLFLNNYPKPSF